MKSFLIGLFASLVFLSPLHAQSTTAATIGVNRSSLQVDTKYPLTFGADLALWINGRDASRKTYSDTLRSVVTSFSSNDNNTHAFSCPTPNKPKFSGNWYWLPNSENITAINAEKTFYKFLHDGSDWEAWFDLYIRSSDVTTTTLFTLLGNSDLTSGKTGISFSFDNRSANSHTRAFNVQIVKSSAGNFVINAFAESAITLDAWNRVRVKRTGTALTIEVELIQFFSGTNANTPVTTDPSDNMTVWSASTSSLRYWRGLVRNIILIKRNLTSTEATNMWSYLNEGSKVIGGGEEANIYFLSGQSNALGQAGSPPTYLQDQMGSFIYTGGQSGFSILDFGVNQQANSGTSFGPELEFVYRMNLLKPGRIFIVKTGISGSTMYLGGDGTSWNVATGNTNGLIHRFNRRSEAALNVLKWQLNRTIKIRGFLWRQGEADSQAPNPYEGGGLSAIQAGYKTDFGDMYRLWIDYINTAGFNTSLCRLSVALVDIPVRDYNTQIVNAQNDVAANMRTDFPAYASKCLDGVTFLTTGFGLLGDGTHFNSSGQVSHGLGHYTALSPFINE